MSTVTPPRSPQEPQSPDSGDNPDPENWVDLVKWCLAKHSRAGWVLAFLLVILVAFVAVTWLLAPHVGALVGVLSGLGASTVGGVVVEVVRRRSDDGTARPRR